MEPAVEEAMASGMAEAKREYFGTQGRIEGRVRQVSMIAIRCLLGKREDTGMKLS